MANEKRIAQAAARKALKEQTEREIREERTLLAQMRNVLERVCRRRIGWPTEPLQAIEALAAELNASEAKAHSLERSLETARLKGNREFFMRVGLRDAIRLMSRPARETEDPPIESPPEEIRRKRGEFVPGNPDTFQAVVEQNSERRR